MLAHIDAVLEGDCLGLLAEMSDGCVDLAYLDPPFNTGKRQAGRLAAFDDVWRGIDAYLSFLRPRVAECRRVLRPSGSLLLHCDWRASHHVRLMLDELFGRKRFVNHLIWSYGLGGSSPRGFARKHDDIFLYGRSSAYYFQPPQVPASSRRMRGMMKKATDVIAIPAINNMARERTGYPTQKPLALLELLVWACCPPGGLVLDPFCGSGTALVAARALGRRYLGIDINAAAVRIARERCATPADERQLKTAP